MIARVHTMEWSPQSDGRGARPWFLIRSKPDGTAECMRNLLGHIRRFKTRETALRWLREESGL